MASLVLLAVSLPFSIAASQLALGLAVIFWLLSLIVDYRSDLILTPLSQVFLFWMVVTLAAAVLGYRPQISLPAIKEEWLFLGFFVAYGGIRSLRHWRLVSAALAISVVVGSLYAVWQHFSGLDLVHERMLTAMLSGYRSQGTLTHLLTFGGVFALIGLFFLPAASNESGWRRHLLIAASVLALLAASLSYARSVQLAIAVGLVLSLALLWRPLGWRVFLIPGALIVLLLAIQPDAPLRFSRERPGAAQISSLSDQAGTRREIWATALNIYSRYPVLGVGQGNFIELYEEYAPRGTITSFAVAHNDLLAVAVSRGTLGVIAYIMIWIALVWQLKRRYQFAVSWPLRIVAASGLIVIAGYLVMSQFEAFFEDEEVRLTLLFLLGVLFARLRLCR